MEIFNNNLWATPIWSFNLQESDIDFNKVKFECYLIKDNDPIGDKYSNKGGYQSAVINSNKVNEINKLLVEIQKYSKVWFEGLGIRKEYNNFINEAWININKKGDYNAPHIHANTIFSGCVYIQYPKDSGKICFVNNHQAHYLASYTNANTTLNSVEYSHSLTEKEVIIFPSYLSHYVEANQSNEDRISIAFDYVAFLK